MAIRFSVSLTVLGMITRRSTKGSATSDASKPAAFSASIAPARSKPRKPNCRITCAQQEGYILQLLEKTALMRTGWHHLVLEKKSFHDMTSLPCPERTPALRALILRIQHQARKMAARQEIMEPHGFSALPILSHLPESSKQNGAYSQHIMMCQNM